MQRKAKAKAAPLALLAVAIEAEAVYQVALRNLAMVTWDEIAPPAYTREEFEAYNPRLFGRPRGASGKIEA